MKKLNKREILSVKKINKPEKNHQKKRINVF